MPHRHGVRRACRGGEGGDIDRRSVQGHGRRHVDERLHLSRDQLFGAPALGRRLCRRAAGLALRLHQFQQRQVFDQPRRRGDGRRRNPADAWPVRVRHRRGLLLLPGRARAGSFELLGSARDTVAQGHGQALLGTDDRLRAGRLAERRVGRLWGRHARLRATERVSSHRPHLVLVLGFRSLDVRPDLGRGRRQRRRRRLGAAGLQQLARRADVQLSGVQARPQLHRHESVERKLLRADR